MYLTAFITIWLWLSSINGNHAQDDRLPPAPHPIGAILSRLAQFHERSNERIRPYLLNPFRGNHRNHNRNNNNDPRVTQTQTTSTNLDSSPMPSTTEPQQLQQRINDQMTPSTEDWSHVLAANTESDSKIKPESSSIPTRKIINVPCNGGLARDGSCRPNFD